MNIDNLTIKETKKLREKLLDKIANKITEDEPVKNLIQLFYEDKRDYLDERYSTVNLIELAREKGIL